MHRSLRAAAFAGGIAAVAVLAGATSVTNAPTADMAVTALRASTGSVSQGQMVWIRQVIENDGPQKVEMDTVPNVHGGRIRRIVCDLGISSDGQDCEYGFVPSGTRLVTRYQVQVAAQDGSLVFAAGVRSEAPELDDNPFNQYRTLTLHVE
jgi:hypothetical protein